MMCPEDIAIQRATGRRTNVWAAGRRGFTVIESIIALVLLIGVMLALIGIVPSAFRDASRDSQAMQAATAAQEYLDALRYYVENSGTNTSLPPPASIAVDAGDSYVGSNTPNASPGNFTLKSNLCPLVGGSTRKYDCVVTASWTEDGQPRSVSVESYVTSEN
jgi:type II secretory pathway pseudopilin PulG